MINSQNIIHVTLFALLLHSCKEPVKNEEDNTREDSIAALRIDSNSNVIQESSIYPYRKVDSLIQALENGYNDDALQNLEIICQQSDGDLAERFYELSKRLFDSHLFDFVKFLADHKESCLKEKLTLGISAEIAVYGEDERLKKIDEERNEYLELAKNKGITSRDMKVISEIFEGIKLELFD